MELKIPSGSIWLQIYITEGSQTVANNLWSQSGIQEIAAGRLQKWAMILSTFACKMQYKATKEHSCNANHTFKVAA